MAPGEALGHAHFMAHVCSLTMHEPSGIPYSYRQQSTISLETVCHG